jgi:hypothetical protein
MAQLDWNSVGKRPAESGASIEERFPEIFSQPEGFAAGAGGNAPGPAAIPAPVDNTDYANMPAMEVARRAVSAAPESFVKQITNVGHAITNPSETLSGLGQIGSGLASKAKGWVGVEQNRQDKAQSEGVLDAILGHYGDVYGGLLSGDTAGLKKELATDPFSIGMDFAALAPIGGAAVRGIGLGQKAGSIVSKAGAMLDPIQASVAAAKNLAVKPAVAIGKGIASGTSGVPRGVMDIAQNVGRMAGPEGAQARKVFDYYATGQGDMSQISNSAMAGLDELRDRSSTNYLSQRQSLTTTPLPTTPILDAINDARAQLGRDRGLDSAEVSAVLDEMENRLLNRTDTTAVGLDNLKRGLHDLVGQWKGSGREGLLAKVPQAVRETIATADPTYAKMMDDWQTWRGELQDLQKELGLGQRTSQSTRLRKMLSDLKKDKNKSLLGKIVQTNAGKNIPYMLAGDAVSSYWPRWAQGVSDVLLYGGLGTLVHPAAWAGLAGASPKLMGKLAKATGSVERTGSKIAPAFRAPATTIMSRLTEDGLPAPAPVEGTEQAAGGRIGRKAGGRVGNAGAEADRLIMAAERAKKAQGNHTSALLNVPDEAITKALAVANENI